MEFERAGADERLAFEALLETQPQSSDYPDVYRRWEQSIQATNRARETFLKSLRAADPGLESGGTG